jgi:hypothetical protein
VLLRLASLGLAAVAFSLASVELAEARPTPLFPGATYESSVEFTPFGPVALHVVRGPRPVGVYRLRPALSNESVVQRETVSSMQLRLSSGSTSAGVNGDYFTLADGRPSGITLRDGILVTPPISSRSSAGVTLDGLLDIRRVSFRGTWRGLGQRRSVNFLNKAPGVNGVSLFTSDWGRSTPQIAGAFAAVLSPFPPATPNVDVSAPVTATAENRSVPIAPGTAVLVARGNAAVRLREEAPVGATITLRLILQPDWATVSDAIGGGPVLVRDGRPVYRANEAFTTEQLALRSPRSAVGQRADGSLLLVATDGRQPGYSIGMTNFELAQAMVRLGAVRAMALDGGGSTTLAFEGTVLNRPADGRERPVATALMLQYFGVYAVPPAEPVVSPNGDGVAEEQKLSYKVVRPSEVTVRLTAPDGVVAYEETVLQEPGTYEIPFPPPPEEQVPPPTDPIQPLPPAEGRWTLSVTATDDQGLGSSAAQRFAVNSTIGFLKVEPARLVLRPTGGQAVVRWTQTRAARTRVTVETPEGVLVRSLALRRMEPGEASVTWNGRLRNGKLAPTGRYVVRVAATNDLGVVTLDGPLVVRRTRR